ncbi:CrcB protein [Sphingomonas kaistensis]|uniref:Fluoride-specific ion channel FluC n=1 Tax=Sphingomonas kaistensis TaxID=298708 RepID=A0A7X5Y3P1_9SPHN|nr:CrcB family protein [Sphingomonas kaistensis]NJC04619.1 CrcB protein [Sphingomonas kaistensis]
MVFVGGGSGAMLRWWLGGLVASPWGTLAVNLIGCLAMGLLAGVLGRSGGAEQARLLLGVGLLGGFTTMSAFALDTVLLWTRAPGTALLYAGLTIAGSLAGLALGLALTR